MSYNSENKTLSVNSTDFADIGTYNMRIKARLNDYLDAYSNFNIIVLENYCELTIITS